MLKLREQSTPPPSCAASTLEEKELWRSRAIHFLSRDSNLPAVYFMRFCKNEGEESKARQKISHFVQEFLWNL